MAYNYEFKYPRKKLHEIVSRYLAQMHTMGRAPNCGVFFSQLALARPDMQGWLLVPGETADAPDRYVLLEDGDVWHDVARPGDGHDAERGWLDAPTDDLAVLLAQSLKSARTGGDGLLATGESVASEVVVEDRRRTMQSFAGREKRSW
jgi:hypothetical protein